MKPISQTKKIAMLAMFTALASLAMLIRIPLIAAAPFLMYDPKDVVIAIGGFMFGPLSALIVIVAVSFIEMISVSDTQLIGFLMNCISSAAFVIPAAIIYKHFRSLKGAVIGLCVGVATTAVVMLAWNYVMMPIHFALLAEGTQGLRNSELLAMYRERVVSILIPAILPFNLIKASLNAALIMISYKHAVAALRHTRLLDRSEEPVKTRHTLPVLLVSLFVVLTLVLIILVLRNVI